MPLMGFAALYPSYVLRQILRKPKRDRVVDTLLMGFALLYPSYKSGTSPVLYHP
jgi:hypothetical protein